MGVLGLVFVGVVLLFVWLWLWVGFVGFLVWNLLGDRIVGWFEVIGVLFFGGSWWVWIDLVDDEYILVMVI